MSDGLTMTESRSGGICIVSLTGRIDSANATVFLTRLNELISAGEKSIVLDFANVLYLTSAAFRALLVATDEAERRTARLALCSLASQVRELFEMGGLLDMFIILGSREEALARFG